MKRDFNNWFSNFRDTIATWKYYTDFDKVYKNTNKIKDELNILNGLIGVENIEDEFRRIVEKFPQTLKAIPILIAKRESEIKIIDPEKTYIFNFKKTNYSIDEYIKFMEKTGLFDLLKNHIIHSLIDYVMGVEVGMDTNGRKSRTGDAMEDLVESYLVNAGLVKDINYFKEMSKSKVEARWGIDLSNISNNGKTEKRFDFVVKTDSTIYAIETNFYSSQGSKLRTTARDYETIALESKQVAGFEFVWFTDGKGWKSARRNLQETFESMENLYCINDLENGVLKNLLK